MHRSVSAHLIWTTEPSHWRQRHLSPPSGELKLGFMQIFKDVTKNPNPHLNHEWIRSLCYATGNLLPWFGFNEQLRNVSIFVVSDHLYMVGVLSP